MEQVLLIVVEHEAAVRQPQHAIAVRAHAGQQTGAARRARRGDVECFAEKHSALGEALQIRRGHWMPIGLQVPAGIVGMNIQDVGPGTL